VILATVYPLYLWHSSWALVFLVVALREALKFPIRLLLRVVRPSPPLAPVPEAFDPRRRMFLGRSMTILAGAAFTGSVVGAMGKDRFEVTDLKLSVKGLPPEFEGFSIALASDIHSSVFMTRETMNRYVEALNEMSADCIAVTGDFVNSMVDEVYPFAEAFSRLKAPHGVYGVLGNHDYYTRNVDAVAREVVDCGIRLLLNEQVTIRRGNAGLHILGVDDTGSHERAGQWFDRALRGTEAVAPKILLCHRPYHFQQAADRKIDLTLSGHTHGGQIVLARIGGDVIAPARVASPYVAGLYAIGSSKMYVSRGIGTVGIPVRINCPPEITKFTLIRGA
jgi:predicted MPP superfamily phosphohydrolase